MSAVCIVLAVLLYLPFVLHTRVLFGVRLSNMQLLNLGLAQVNLMLISMLGDSRGNGQSAAALAAGLGERSSLEVHETDHGGVVDDPGGPVESSTPTVRWRALVVDADAAQALGQEALAVREDVIEPPDRLRVQLEQRLDALDHEVRSAPVHARRHQPAIGRLIATTW